MPDEKSIFKAFLRKKCLKWTPQRAKILDGVCSTGGHFEADDLLMRLRKKNSKVSKGSIYRTIKLLEESRIIRPVVFTERHTHYENITAKKHHSHLICLKCGRIIEFYRPRIREGLKEACKERGFKEIEHRVEITGLCKNCK